MNIQNLKELNNLINNSIQDNKKYDLLNKRYQIIIGYFLLCLSLILIGILIFLTHDLAIQQALIAIIGILIIAALETFKSSREDKKIDFFTPSIKLDNRTFIYGDYNSKETISNYTSNQKQNLVEAAAEIQKLLNQISKTHPIETTQEKMIIAAEVVEEIENSPTLKQRVASALKAGGIAALENMLTHPAAAITVAALEAWKSEETEAQEK
jgi:predicted lipid-binding transport protein (Tim44 family)